MTSIDRAIVSALYGVASEHPIARLLTLLFGHWSGYAIAPAFLLWAFLIWRRSGRPTLLAQAALAALSSRIVLEIIRFAWNIERPFMALDIPPIFAPFENGPSFPSGHATFYFALAAVAWNRSKKISALLFAAASLMAIARVAAGVHWPADVIAGATLGIAAGRIVLRVISS